MRIRLHKSRSVTSAFIAGILVVSGVSVAAPTLLNALNAAVDQIQGNSQVNNNAPGQDGTMPGKSGSDPGNSCTAHSNNGNINSNGNYGAGSNGQTHGNGEAADCQVTITYVAGPNGRIDGPKVQILKPDQIGETVTAIADNGYHFVMWTPGSSTNPVRTDSYGTFPTSTTVTASFALNVQNVCQNGADDYPTCTPGKPPKDLTAQASPTASPLPVAKIIIPKLTKTTTKYNRQRQGISYTVEPSTATCKVTYNGSSALPTNAGTYNIVIKCKDGRVTGGTTGTFVIEKGQPQLTWDNPNPITTTDALTRSELKAKSDVVGTLEYAPALGIKMPAGTHNLKVTLTPRDTKNYLSAATSVKLLVTEKAVVIVKPKKFAAIKIPFTLSSAGLTKKTRPMISNIFKKNKVTSVTVYGYVQPTKDKSNDMTLSKSRAQTVAKQLKKLNPKLKITIKAMGATINPACKAEKNKCVIVS